MLTSVEGVYRDGRIELVENPMNMPEGTWVIVTFVRSGDIDLKSQGIDREQAKTLRTSLATFAEDWDSPEMSIYDNYDTAKTNS
jgi:hydrogenase maturation factor